MKSTRQVMLFDAVTLDPLRVQFDASLLIDGTRHEVKAEVTFTRFERLPRTPANLAHVALP